MTEKRRWVACISVWQIGERMAKNRKKLDDISKKFGMSIEKAQWCPWSWSKKDLVGDPIMRLGERANQKFRIMALVPWPWYCLGCWWLSKVGSIEVYGQNHLVITVSPPCSGGTERSIAALSMPSMPWIHLMQQLSSQLSTISLVSNQTQETRTWNCW